jgi:hypothetical protein
MSPPSFSPFHNALSSPITFFRTSSIASLFCFHTYVKSTLTIFVLLHPLHFASLLSLVPTPGQDLFYLPVLHLSRCMLIIQGFFPLLFHTCVICTLIRLTYLLLFLNHHAIISKVYSVLLYLLIFNNFITVNNSSIHPEVQGILLNTF